MIARENQLPVSRSVRTTVFGLDIVDEPADEAQDDVARPNLFPLIGCSITMLRQRGWEIAAAVLALIEGQEARCWTIMPGRFLRQVWVHGKE